MTDQPDSTFHRYGAAWIRDSAVLAAERSPAGKTRIHLTSGTSVDVPEAYGVTPEDVARITTATNQPKED